MKRLRRKSLPIQRFGNAAWRFLIFGTPLALYSNDSEKRTRAKPLCHASPQPSPGFGGGSRETVRGNDERSPLFIVAPNHERNSPLRSPPRPKSPLHPLNPLGHPFPPDGPFSFPLSPKPSVHPRPVIASSPPTPCNDAQSMQRHGQQAGNLFFSHHFCRCIGARQSVQRPQWFASLPPVEARLFRFEIHQTERTGKALSDCESRPLFYSDKTITIDGRKVGGSERGESNPIDKERERDEPGAPGPGPKTLAVAVAPAGDTPWTRAGPLAPEASLLHSCLSPAKLVF